MPRRYPRERIVRAEGVERALRFLGVPTAMVRHQCPETTRSEDLAASSRLPRSW